MKNSIKKILFMEIIILVVIIANFFIPFLFDNYKYLIFLVLFGVVGFFLIGLDLNKSPNEVPIFKKTLFYLMIYFLLIYIIGLYIGFARTIYSFSFTNLVKNILPTITVIVVSEALRFQFIKKSNNNKLILLLCFLVFTLLDIAIGFYNYNLTIKDEIYEFIGVIVIGSITKNILMTIFDMKGDFYNAASYRFIMELYIFLIPIVPDLGAYLSSVLLIIFPLLLALRVYTMKEKKILKPSVRKRNSIIYSIVIIVLLFLVGLNTGIFKYQSIVIGSNSMKPFMEKGDIIIIDRLTEKQKNILKKGDIIVFRRNNRIVSHRIYSVVKNSSGRYYITKGDSNNQVDVGVTNDKEVLGVVKLRFKSIGLPSVWLSELFD